MLIQQQTLTQSWFQSVQSSIGVWGRDITGLLFLLCDDCVFSPNHWTETWMTSPIFSGDVACFSFRFWSVFRAAAVSSKCLSKHVFLWRFLILAKVFTSVLLTNCSCTDPWHVKGVSAWNETWQLLMCHDRKLSHFHCGMLPAALSPTLTSGTHGGNILGLLLIAALNKRVAVLSYCEITPNN